MSGSVRRLGLLLAVAAGCGCAGPDDAVVMLELDPASASACELPTISTVTWDATSRGIESVRLEVAEVGQLPKLWATAEARGQADTGPWMKDGDSILLKTPEGVLLAQRTLTSSHCAEDPDMPE